MAYENETGFGPQDEDKVLSHNVQECARLLEIFMQRTESMIAPVSFASSPAWYNDVCEFNSQQVRVNNTIISTVDDGGEIEEMVHAISGIEGAHARILLDLMYGELTYFNASKAIGNNDDEVIRFAKVNDGGEPRYFIHAWDSNGFYKFQCEKVGNELLVWTPPDDSSNSTTRALPREEAVAHKIPDDNDFQIF